MDDGLGQWHRFLDRKLVWPTFYQGAPRSQGGSSSSSRILAPGFNRSRICASMGTRSSRDATRSEKSEDTWRHQTPGRRAPHISVMERLAV